MYELCTLFPIFFFLFGHRIKIKEFSIYLFFQYFLICFLNDLNIKIKMCTHTHTHTHTQMHINHFAHFSVFVNGLLVSIRTLLEKYVKISSHIIIKIYGLHFKIFNFNAVC